ncbi:MAG: acetyl-CoA decarbonylase/synthase complex subunit gamma [Methanimicrococcus sp.]|nr:acetyl-CoA decarbonylase/synthase complex subunit gamma [Methanimicrococcus sp.]
MAKTVSPLEIYPYLPDDCETLFKIAETESKMAVAAKLAGRKLKMRDIREIYEQLPPEFMRKYEKLTELLKPAIAEIEIGAGDKKITIGGDDVMFRHTLSFYNKPPIAADVWDTMTGAELLSRLEKITAFRKFYVGDFLYLDMVAVRSVSGSSETFGKCVETVVKNCDLPLILCTKNPEIMRSGLKSSAGKNPLMYACDTANREKMTQLAIEFDVPVVVCGGGDLDTLQTLAMTLQNDGVDKIVLDPGMPVWGADFKKAFQNFIKIRKAGMDGGMSGGTDGGIDGGMNGGKALAFPLIALPIAARTDGSGADRSKEKLPPEIVAGYHETMAASALTIRYADLMIIHGLEAHELLPLVHVTDMIYTDPRTPSAVEPKLYRIGHPGPESPVLFTTNFALTYYTVESDLTSAGFNGFLLAVNTGGLGVEAAVAGGQLTAEVIKKGFEDAAFDIKAETKHGTLILPGLAARLQNDIEKIMEVSTLVGPMDSGRLAKWLEENRPPKKEKDS